jgi:(E)-2-((N-methylformamido)methylene)succinate hydrolase
MMSQILRLSDGARIRGLHAGEKGAPLLLLHGVGLRAEAWGPQIAALADGARVIAVDLPGHGESDPLPGGAGLPDYVAWAARVVQALGLGAVNIAGHSMGALIAAGLAVDRPELVSRVALLNAVFRRSPAARIAVLARAAEIAVDPGDSTAALARWFTPAEKLLRDQVAGWLQGVSHQGYATAYRAFAEGDQTYADRISAITCPLLAMTGDGDPNSTPEMSRMIAALAPQGAVEVIAGHRHMVNLTAPQTVTLALQRWLCTEKVTA